MAMPDQIARIDALGRLVIPKPLRQRLGLAAGSRVRLVEAARALHLEILDEDVPVSSRDGLPVLGGEPTGSLAEAVEAQRQARLHDLGGE
jgi:AbrB family looped-hinge helix DNA binding protein